jgi:cytoskeleton protein RodZ
MFSDETRGSEMSLPERLKAARESRGWTIEEVGSQLKLPARVIARVEQGDFEGLGAPIYRRGYLRSFARLVGVPDDDVAIVLGQESVADPELVATGVMARSEYVTERYLRPATYIALTALIALPVVWWAASGRLGQELAGRGSFDLQPPPLSLTSTAINQIQPERPQPLPITVPPSTEMVRASMMSVPPSPEEVGPAVPVDILQSTTLSSEAGNVIGVGGMEAVLELTANSWVEVSGPSGQRVHQALLTPGQWRYRSDGELSFTIGNSRNATLTAQGEPIDLAASRSSNDVARVSVFRSEG